jgi:hypothetical protein
MGRTLEQKPVDSHPKVRAEADKLANEMLGDRER